MPVVPKEALKVEIDDQLQILYQVVNEAREYLTGHLLNLGIWKLPEWESLFTISITESSASLNGLR